MNFLEIKKGEWYIDATFGRGGHTAEILKRGGKVIAFDRDAEAIAYGTHHFATFIENSSLKLIENNFDSLISSIESHFSVQPKVEGILFDFGTSREQLTSVERGFSFIGDGPLDMRMDQNLGVTAADLLVVMTEQQLADILFHFGGEVYARKIARRIKRCPEAITTTSQLAALVSSAIPGRGKLHAATKTFQALRIAVNSELDAIEKVLPQALEVIHSGGRLVTISFHEGEDRPVKKTFTAWQNANLGEVLTSKPVVPSKSEVEKNQAARSAKLRAFRKK